MQAHEESFTLTPDVFVDLAKSTLKANKCEWDGCPAILNSWYALHKHIDKRHCTRVSKNKAGSYECRMPRCTARSHSSPRDLLRHIDSNHASRYPLPCPIRGCDETFVRPNYIPVHFSNHHADLNNITISLSSPLLKPTYHPLRPSALKPPPPLPALAIEPHRLLLPTVVPAPLKADKPPSKVTPLGRKWSKLSAQDDADPSPGKAKGKEKARHDEDEPECVPLDDLPRCPVPAEDEDPDYVAREYVLKRKPPEAWVGAALSMPPALTGPAESPADPPTSIGFDAFQARYLELEKVGLIQGDGVWPERTTTSTAAAAAAARRVTGTQGKPSEA